MQSTGAAGTAAVRLGQARAMLLSAMAAARCFGLDVLRAAAIALVLLAHFDARHLHGFGVLGVELFFVLSGFLIGGLLFRSVVTTQRFTGGDLLTFWKRRWLRTLPNYYLFLVLSILLAPLSAFERGYHPADLWMYPLFLQNLAWDIPRLMAVSWSLAVEEWFYLLFPLLALALAGLVPGRLGTIRAFHLTTLVFLAVPLLLRLLVPCEGVLGQRMIVVYRLDAMMYGVVMAIVRHDFPALWPRLRTLAVPGLILAAVSAVFLVRAEAHPDLGGHAGVLGAVAFSVFPLGFALLLPAASQLADRDNLAGRCVSALAAWSYSIYLCHMLVYGIALRLTGYDALPTASKLLIKLAILAAIIALAALNHRWFEQPILRLRERWAADKPPATG